MTLRVVQQGDKRFYKINGDKVPSVTTVLGVIDKSGPLVGWAVRETCDYIEKKVDTEYIPFAQVIAMARKEATRIRDEAGDVGIDVHHAIQTWVKLKTMNGADDYDPGFTEPRRKKAWEAFLAWAKKVNLRPIRTEQTVFNPTHMYAGTLDLVAVITLPEWAEKKGKKSRMFVIDVKTSKAYYPIPMGPQVVAYEKCFHPKEFDGVGLLHLSKDTGEPTFHDLTPHKRKFWSVFLAARQLFKTLELAKKEKK